MAQSQGRRPYTRTEKKRPVPDSRTKFDVWLDGHLTEGESVAFLFKHDPISGAKLVRLDCTILTVDRYHVYLEIDDEAPVWVAKDNIIGAQ